MIKINFILIFFISFHIACGSIIQADIDEVRDEIVYNGKVYYPSTRKLFEEKSSQELNEEKKEIKYSEHEEEIVEGAQFWMYIFIILCM